jgi:GT2 family glycosyltransferase
VTTLLTAPGPPTGSFEAVQALTESIPVAVTVTAVVVTRGHSPFLESTLAAVRDQQRIPDDVVVVDIDAARTTGSELGLRTDHDGARFVAAGGVQTFGQAVDAALAAHGQPGGWMWLLHDDSAPEPEALLELLRAIEHTQAVGIVGCKQRRWPLAADGTPAPQNSSGSVLIEVGHTVTPLGRRFTGIDDTEIDQGQHDSREDVLAVGLAGALVKSSLWAALDGTDPEYGTFGDGTDFCRRARRAGHRVVVVPEAVIHHGQSSLLGLRAGKTTTQAGSPLSRAPRSNAAQSKSSQRKSSQRAASQGSVQQRNLQQGIARRESSYRARRSSELHHRLVHAPLPLAVLAWFAMILWAPVAAAAHVAWKHPGRARAEIRVVLTRAVRLGPLVRARRRVARTSTQPRRDLRPLLASWRQIAQQRKDAHLARAAEHKARTQVDPLDQLTLTRCARQRWVAAGVITVLSVVGIAVLFNPWWGPLMNGGRVVGGALLPAPDTLARLWQAATSGWVASGAGGLGIDAPADPVLMPLLGATAMFGGSLQTAVHVLVLGAIPLAALGAWFGAGAVTRNIPARLGASAAWALSPVMLESLAEGRLGTLMALGALPWAVVAVLRAIGAHARDAARPTPPGSATSLGAAAAAGLLLAVATSGAPMLLPLVTAGLLAGMVVARAGRANLAVALVPPLIVAAPFWWRVAHTWTDGGWRMIFAEPGVPLVASNAPEPWQMLAGYAAAPAPWFGTADPGGVIGAAGTGDAPGTAGSLGMAAPYILGVLILLAAVWALLRRGRVRASRTLWLVAAPSLALGLVAVAVGEFPGVAVAMVYGALLVAALLAVPRVDATGHTPGGRWMNTLSILVVALAGASTAAWVVADGSPPHGGDLHVAPHDVVPPVGQEFQSEGQRVLQVGTAPDGLIQYTLMHTNGTSLTDVAVAARATSPTTGPSTEVSDTAPSGTAPSETAPSGPAASLPTVLDELVADLSLGSSPTLAPRLDALSVAAVQVPPGTDPELVATLDLTDALVRVTETEPYVWRVAADDVSAAHDSDAAQENEATPDANATQTSETAQPSESPQPSEDFPALPAPTSLPYRTLWLTVLGAVVVVYALLAVPIKRRGW